jgi:hypothetical protein
MTYTISGQDYLFLPILTVRTRSLAIYDLGNAFRVICYEFALIDCVDVADVRQTFYNANSLSNLFTNVAGDTILQFLKEIDLYTNILLYNMF